MVKIEVTGLDKLSAKIAAARARVSDASDFFRHDLLPDFQRIMLDHFASGGNRAGGWAPLSPRYAAQKAKRFPGKPIMRASDVLFESLTNETAEGAIRRITGTMAEFGTSVPYAMAHQKPKKAGRIARPPVGLSPEDRNRWVKLYKAHVTSDLKAAGL